MQRPINKSVSHSPQALTAAPEQLLILHGGLEHETHALGVSKDSGRSPSSDTFETWWKKTARIDSLTLPPADHHGAGSTTEAGAPSGRSTSGPQVTFQERPVYLNNQDLPADTNGNAINNWVCPSCNLVLSNSPPVDFTPKGLCAACKTQLGGASCCAWQLPRKRLITKEEAERMFRSDDPTDKGNAKQLMKLLQPDYDNISEGKLTNADLLAFVPLLFLMQESAEAKMVPFEYYGRLDMTIQFRGPSVAPELGGLIKQREGGTLSFAMEFCAMDAFWKPEQSGEVRTNLTVEWRGIHISRAS